MPLLVDLQKEKVLVDIEPSSTHMNGEYKSSDNVDMKPYLATNSDIPLEPSKQRSLSESKDSEIPSQFFTVVPHTPKLTGKPTPPPRRVVLPLEPLKLETSSDDSAPLLLLNLSSPINTNASASTSPPEQPIKVNGSTSPLVNLPSPPKLTSQKSAELTKLLEDAVQQMKSMHLSTVSDTNNGRVSPIIPSIITNIPESNCTIKAKGTTEEKTSKEEAEKPRVVTETSFASANPITRSLSSASNRDISVQALKIKSSQLSPWHVDSNGVSSPENPTSIRRTVMTTEL